LESELVQAAAIDYVLGNLSMSVYLWPPMPTQTRHQIV